MAVDLAIRSMTTTPRVITGFRAGYCRKMAVDLAIRSMTATPRVIIGLQQATVGRWLSIWQ